MPLFIVISIGQNRIIYEYHSMQGQASPLFYIHIVSILFSFIFQLLFYKRLWLNQSKYLELINFIHCTCLIISKRVAKFQSKFVVNLICLVFLLIALYEAILKSVPPPCFTISDTLWSSKTVSLARFTFFMVNLTESQRTLDSEEITALDAFLTVLYVLGWLTSIVVVMYHSLMHIFAVLTVWWPCYTFAKDLREDLLRINNSTDDENANQENFEQVGVSLKWTSVYEMYDNIRELCHCTNEAFGTLFTIYLASCIVAQAAGLDAALVTSDYLAKMQQTLVMGLSIVTFLIAADACDKVGTLIIWLAKDSNRENIPMDQLNVIMAELHNRDIGIRGSNIFTLTYPALWRIMTTVITYFIICVQARQQGTQTQRNK